MTGHSRPKYGVASARLCPAIHVFLAGSGKDVDARQKAGHDDVEALAPLDEWTSAQARHRRRKFAAVFVDIGRWLRHRLDRLDHLDAAGVANVCQSRRQGSVSDKSL